MKILKNHMKDHPFHSSQLAERSGYVSSFSVGVNKDKIELVCWEDDGTRDKHLTIFYKDVPVGTCPLCNDSGLIHFIYFFLDVWKETYDQGILKELLKEYIKELREIGNK